MYASEHIVSATILATAASRRLKIKFVLLAAILIATNLIDFDHLLNYYKDDGSANSLILHPLHIYAGVTIFILSILGLIDKKRLNWYFCINAGIALHLAEDAFAYAFNYNIPTLVGIGIILLIVLFWIIKKLMPPEFVKSLWAFFGAVWLLGHAERAFTFFYLQVDPLTSRVFWIIPPLYTLGVAIVFWLIFSRTDLDERLRSQWNQVSN